MEAEFCHLLGRLKRVYILGPVDKGPSLQVSGLYTSKSDDELTLFGFFHLGCRK